MNWLMRMLFGLYPMAIVEGEGGGGGGEPAEPGGEGAEVVIDDGAEDPAPGVAAPAEGESPAAEPGAKGNAPAPAQATESAMLEGIKKVLKPADPEAEKKAKADAEAAEKKKREDADFEASLKGKTPEEQGKLRTAREAEAKKAAKAAEDAALKDKKADDFQLTPQMKRFLSGEAQQRFHHLHRYAKEQETKVVELTEQNTAISKARDEMMGLFAEHQVEPEDLGALLDYNRRVKTGDLQGALQIIEAQRVALYKALGREPDGGGVDLLAEFPDLAQRVKDMELKREDALQIANARRRDAALEQRRGQEGNQQRAAEQRRQAEDKALNDIDAWAQKKAKDDIDFKAKEEKVLERFKSSIMKRYPPTMWLQAMQDVYDSIEIAKAEPVIPGDPPLRPSGARPGAKQFTELTPEALRQGLGYPPSAG